MESRTEHFPLEDWDQYVVPLLLEILRSLGQCIAIVPVRRELVIDTICNHLSTY